MSCYHGISFFLAIVVLMFLVASGHYDDSRTGKVCNGEQKPFGDYQDNKEKALLNLIDETPRASGYDYYHMEGVESKSPCYVHAMCSHDIGQEDCRFCLVNAEEEIDQECRLNIGARFEFVDCGIRFENYKFY